MDNKDKNLINDELVQKEASINSELDTLSVEQAQIADEPQIVEETAEISTDEQEFDYMSEMASMIEDEITKKEKEEIESSKAKDSKIKKPKFLQKQEKVKEEIKENLKEDVSEEVEEEFDGSIEDLALLQKQELKEASKETLKKKSKKDKSDDNGEPSDKKGVNPKVIIIVSVALIVLATSAIFASKLLKKEPPNITDEIVEVIDDEDDKAVDTEDIDNTLEEDAELEETEVVDEENVNIDEEVDEETDEEETILDTGILKQLSETQAVIDVSSELKIFTLKDNVYELLKDIPTNNEIYFEYLDTEIVNVYSLDEEDIETEETVDIDPDDENIDDFFDSVFEEGEKTQGTDEFYELFKDDFGEELDFIREREIQDTFDAIEEERKNQEQELILQSKTETIEYPMQVKANGNLWFRFAWKPNDTTPSVAKLEDVVIELKNNNGTLITPSNIDRYGRYWINNNVINFAIKNGQQGKWTFVVTKKVKDKLGEIGANVVPMEGFIEVQKFAVKAQREKLLAVWKVGGMKDQDLAVEIFARRNGQDTLIYSANSADDTLYTLDRVEINTSKLPKGKYDIVFKVQDIKVGKNDKGQPIITQKYITDEYVVSEVEIY